MSPPLRPGDVWLADLSPVIGSEQAGHRPVVIVSGPLHLALPHAVVFVVPVTSRDRGLRHQIPIASQSSGLSKLPSYTRPEDARAVVYQRLDRRLGAVTSDELAAVRRILRAFLDLLSGKRARPPDTWRPRPFAAERGQIVTSTVVTWP